MLFIDLCVTPKKNEQARRRILRFTQEARHCHYLVCMLNHPLEARLDAIRAQKEWFDHQIVGSVEKSEKLKLTRMDRLQFLFNGMLGRSKPVPKVIEQESQPAPIKEIHPNQKLHNAMTALSKKSLPPHIVNLLDEYREVQILLATERKREENKKKLTATLQEIAGDIHLATRGWLLGHFARPGGSRLAGSYLTEGRMQLAFRKLELEPFW